MDKDADPTRGETVHDRLQGARNGVATLGGEVHRAAGRMAALQEDVTMLRDKTDRLRHAIRDVREAYAPVPAPCP